MLLAVPAPVGLPALAILRGVCASEEHDIAACAPGEEVEVIGLGPVLMPVPAPRA